jgi:hypothetical protein
MDEQNRDEGAPPPQDERRATTVEDEPRSMSPTIGEPISEASLAVSLARAEVDQQIMTAHAFPRSIRAAVDAMASMATLNPDIAEECIYSVPRGGKTIRGPSIRFAEIVANAWGNCRDAARVTFVDRIERYVEAEGIFHDLQTNRATTSRVKRTIELKKKSKTIDKDMENLAGAAAMSIARRNAILGGVPKPVWGQAIEEVESVIRGDIKTLGERRDKAMAWFSKTGILADRVLKALAAPSIDDITLDDLVTMNGWRTALLGGDATVEDIFPEDKPPAERKTLDQKLDALAGTKDAAVSPTAEQGEGGGVTSNAPSPEPERGVAADRTPISDAPPSAGDKLQTPEGRKEMMERMDSGLPREPEPPKDPKSERRLALAGEGDRVANRGPQALKEWLDDLDGNDSALVTISMTKRWSKLASEPKV